MAVRRIQGALSLIGFSAAMWLLGVAAPAHGADSGTGFHRGIGVSHAMAWARIEPGPERAFAFPPFAAPDNALTADELTTLRHAGFDFVRLAVDPGPFLQFQGARRNELDRILMDRVNLIRQSDLSVIVDFHPSDLHPDYTAEALTANLSAPLFADYLQLVGRTAGLLDKLHDERVALELLNEPPLPQHDWQPMLEAAYIAARRRAPGLILILEGGEEASAAALMAMRTDPFAKDRAALFAFHYYDPYQFTHQGAPWNDARYLADVPYPAAARPLADSLDASAAAIAAGNLLQQQKSAAYRDAQRQLESYQRSAFGPGAIATRFDQIADWARSQGVPADRVMLGEFGARKTALQLYGVRAAERAQWFRDVSEAAQAHRFGWAVWTFKGPGFGLSRSESSSDIEPGVAEALGLSVRTPRKAANIAPSQSLSPALRD